MLALFFEGGLTLKEIPVPEPSRGEVLVRILYSAICNTDLEIIKGYMSFTGVPGHEFVGQVITPGHALTGRNVVGEINCSCGHCYMCRIGRPTHCFSRTVVGIAGHQGVFTEYICLPEGNLHIVPDSIPLPLAVFTEPLAAAAEIFEQLHIRPTEKVFILGAGKLGLLAAMVARLNGLDYTSFDTIAEKVDFAVRLGINARHLSSLEPDEKAGVCIDCSGSRDGAGIALSLLYPRGTLVLKTTVAETAKTDLNCIVVNELTVMGSRCGPFRPALNLLERKLADPRPLISGVFPFSDILKAFETAMNPLSLKIIIKH